MILRGTKKNISSLPFLVGAKIATAIEITRQNRIMLKTGLLVMLAFCIALKY